jgi:hypothetical protein
VSGCFARYAIPSGIRARANAPAIEARARMRLAEEYDAAQDRGEVAGHGGGETSRLRTATLNLPSKTLAFGATKSTRPVNSAMQNGQTPWGRAAGAELAHR